MITNTKLDPIETASVDELQALQTQRLKWTLKHAYDNVAKYRRKINAAGLCRADGTSGAHSCFFGNHR